VNSIQKGDYYFVMFILIIGLPWSEYNYLITGRWILSLKRTINERHLSGTGELIPPYN
jgi:hypothetical protein